jgi:trehalose 6-phosphate synthase
VVCWSIALRLVIRFICLLVGSVLLVSVASSYYQVQQERHNLREELQKRAEVLAESLGQNLEASVQAKATAELERSVERFGNKEHLVGIAIYSADGELLARTRSLDGRLEARPAILLKSMAGDYGTGQFTRAAGVPTHLFAAPLHGETGTVGGLLIVHDASYITDATKRAWREVSVRVLLQICLLALTTFIMFHRSVMAPIAKTTAWMRDLRHGRIPSEDAPDAAVLGLLAVEANGLAKSLADARASATQEARLRETAETYWTAERLAVCLQTKLNDSRLFVVSNREPYMHTRQGKTVQAVVPASGLVTGLEPILRACDGTWVAHGSGNADRETVDERDRLRVPPENPRYTLRRVWLNKEQEAGYYLGFSNEGLWPLCHIAHTRPTFRAADWEQYKQVNELFAEAVLEEMAGTEKPVVIVQDYHFALLPKLIKQRRPDARVGIFWHIPWPNAEAFGICPWQHELLDGLLGADLIGFHVQAHCDNFLETVNAAMESRIEWERFAVNRGEHVTLVRPFPISVTFPDEPKIPQKPFHAHQAALLEEIAAEALYVGVGVDRVDYTKGILERFLGIERFLEKYPQYQGKFSFVQIGAPSRTDIKRYHDFLDEVDYEAGRINHRFGKGKWQPILFRKWHHNHAEVSRFYRAADLCLVTSLHDGMNLVAKEFIVTRHDEDGVLILSPFTGAARELPDALIVNPYDTESLADAIFASLEMDPAERKSRMHRMRTSVKKQNVYWWAGNLIGELCQIRVSGLRLARRGMLPRAVAGQQVGGDQLLDDLANARAAAAGSHQMGA